MFDSIFLLNVFLFFSHLFIPFFIQYKGRVKDWDMATLLRLDSSKEFSEENSTIGLTPFLRFLLLHVYHPLSSSDSVPLHRNRT